MVYKSKGYFSLGPRVHYKLVGACSPPPHSGIQGGSSLRSNHCRSPWQGNRGARWLMHGLWNVNLEVTCITSTHISLAKADRWTISNFKGNGKVQSYHVPARWDIGWTALTNTTETRGKQRDQLRGFYNSPGKRWEQLRPGSHRRSVRKQMQKTFWRQRQQDLLMDWMWNNRNCLTVDLRGCRLNRMMYMNFFHTARRTMSLNNGDYYCCSSRLKRCWWSQSRTV